MCPISSSKRKEKSCFYNKDDTPSNRLKIEGFCEAIQPDDSTEVPHVIWIEGDDEWKSGYDATMRLVQE